MDGKKGMELSLNVIIVAIVLFIVMIILVALFTGKMGGIRKSLNKTESQYSQDKCQIPGTDRVCVITQSSCENRGGFVYEAPQGGKWSDCYLGQICCSQ
ncbi:hypothetical protein COV19_06470 [Candidatus Woesearchaeota archaeon CG10_big_fil_rev_8_21_14_0_10_44_13]|nr:MAG: hypothetical protein COV19_06470 [Candidatus Woesearchaeota archaeon CG10_big_fil_rev_8_21_14_0_10_44_13]